MNEPMSAEEKLEKIAAWIDQEKNPDAIFECPWCAYICEILDAPSAEPDDAPPDGRFSQIEEGEDEKSMNDKEKLEEINKYFNNPEEFDNEWEHIVKAILDAPSAEPDDAPDASGYSLEQIKGAFDALLSECDPGGTITSRADLLYENVCEDLIEQLNKLTPIEEGDNE